MYDFMASFEENTDGDYRSTAHPADAVPHLLASANAEHNSLRIKELDSWYRLYAEKRENPLLVKSCSSFVPTSTLKVWKHIFKLTHLHLKFGNTFLLRFCPIFLWKKCSSKVLDRSMENDTLKLPISALKCLFSCPALLWLWCYNMHGFTM